MNNNIIDTQTIRFNVRLWREASKLEAALWAKIDAGLYAPKRKLRRAYESALRRRDRRYRNI